MTIQYEGSSALPEGLRYYLLRGAIMVPLIPADQLPYQLRGIPRHLSHRQMSDEGWKLFKETRDLPSLLSLQAPADMNLPAHCSPVLQTQYRAPDHHVRTESSNAHVINDGAGQWSQLALEKAQTLRVSRTPSTARGERSSPLYDTIASVYHKDTYRQTYPSGVDPSPSKKVYCTHWIKKGTCDFMPTGCKYKHEMPGIDQLRRMGISNEIPKWWRDKSAVKSPTWMQQQFAAKGGAERAEEVHAPRAFPDPATFTTWKGEKRNDANEDAQKRCGLVKRDSSGAQLKASPAKPRPSTPVQPSLPRTTQIPNLINLEDTPSSPEPSQPLSKASSDTLIPSHRSSAPSSESPPSIPLLIDDKITHDETRKPSTRSPRTKDVTPPRRQSHTSWPSDTSDTDTPLPTRTMSTSTSTSTAMKQTKHPQYPRKCTPATTHTPRNVPPCRGLINSKYAVLSTTTTPSFLRKGRSAE